jgi:hypothetical protein
MQHHCSTQPSAIDVSSGSTLFSVRYELNLYICNVGLIKECSRSEALGLTVALCRVFVGRLYSFFFWNVT